MSQTNSGEKILVIIADGLGLNMPYKGNAHYLAHTPVFDKLWREAPTAVLQASEEAVGLPAGQMGNSEVGHMTIGSGRINYQDLMKINKAVEEKTLDQEKILQQAIEHVKKHNSKLHIKGLYSPGGVHSHQDHIDALLKIAAESGLRSDQVFFHVITDGRDTPPQAAKEYLQHLKDYLAELGIGKISTLVGRYYAMDRDHNWDRTDKAFNLMTQGEGKAANDIIEAIQQSYAQGENDEFVEPVKFGDKNEGLIQENDAVIFANFRSDRPRQLVERFLEKGPSNLFYVTMTTYNPDYEVHVVFPEKTLDNTIGEVLSKNNISQLRVTETVKFPHLTYFLNGKHEEPFAGEDRIMIKTYSDIKTDAEKPQMRTPEIKEEILKDIAAEKHQVIFTNFPNGDMVGHTGNIEATIKGYEVVDQAYGEVLKAAQARGYHVLFFSDHGNGDELINPKTGEVMTAHSLNPVPFILVSTKHNQLNRYVGGLSDIAPTILKILGIEQPAEMTGQSLI
jgi:2,3-bisphosphoglycerate-independent phosphoglycerate mutase